MLILKYNFVSLIFIIIIFAKNVESAGDDGNVTVVDDNGTMSENLHELKNLSDYEIKKDISYLNATKGAKNLDNNNSRQLKSLMQFDDDGYEELMTTDLEETTANTVSLNGHSQNSEHHHDFNVDETTQSTTKKAKQLEIYKTRPNELLRHYVEDTHLRPPIAALVDKKINPLTKARQLWRTAVRPAVSNLEVMLVSYDSEGNEKSGSK